MDFGGGISGIAGSGHATLEEGAGLVRVWDRCAYPRAVRSGLQGDHVGSHWRRKNGEH
jgi:hypothetical protein